eukprot:5281201-Lingulodinium_polyedra.AAC.1
MARTPRVLAVFYQESMFCCELYIDNQKFAKRQPVALLVAAKRARGLEPDQMAEARAIFRCCIYCALQYHDQ